jgi:hypothetical protein
VSRSVWITGKITLDPGAALVAIARFGARIYELQ